MELFGLMVMDWVKNNPGFTTEDIQPEELGINDEQLWMGIEYFYWTVGFGHDIFQ